LSARHRRAIVFFIFCVFHFFLSGRSSRPRGPPASRFAFLSASPVSGHIAWIEMERSRRPFAWSFLIWILVVAH
jgi:hypothetical protein